MSHADGARAALPSRSLLWQPERISMKPILYNGPQKVQVKQVTKVALEAAA
jgi:hypothetical protein